MAFIEGICKFKLLLCPVEEIVPTCANLHYAILTKTILSIVDIKISKKFEYYTNKIINNNYNFYLIF